MKVFIVISLFFYVVKFLTAQESAWRYPNGKNVESDIVIHYEVKYDRELTEEEKESTSVLNEIVISVKGDKLVERRVFNKSEYYNKSHYTLYDYAKEQFYYCYVKESSKQATNYPFKIPKKDTTLILLEKKKELKGYSCDRIKASFKGLDRELLVTKEMGLRFCRGWDVDGFLLQFTGSNTKLGGYIATATNISYEDLPDELFSLEGFDVKTYAQIKQERKEREEKQRLKSLEEIGKKGASFKALTIDGEKISKSQFNGKALVLNFGFAKCPACVKEMPKLNTLYQKYEKSKDVEFISISLDPTYKAAKFTDKYDFKFKMIADGRWLAEKYHVTTYPTNIVLDKKGVVKFYEIGYKKDIVERISFEIDRSLK